ncbi:MAG: 4'-phosphopantetheinyl transferase superfamily protein [Pseudomonadota bacterium]
MTLPWASVNTAFCRELEALIARRMPQGMRVAAGPIERHLLCPEEEAMIEQAVAKRQAEFSTGRALAHRALINLGYPAEAIGIGPLRNPIWPKGTLGSISHDGGCCVALAGKDTLRGIGLDLMHIPSHAGRMRDLLDLYVADSDELKRLPDLPKQLRPEMVLFSLKESIVKALVGDLDDFVDLRDISLQNPWGKVRGPTGQERHMTLWIDHFGSYLITGAIYAR